MSVVSGTCSVLVLGGARSGKSGYARQLAEASGRALVFVATATAADAEMTARIARHRAERDARWRLIEEPLSLVETLERETGRERIVLVDCVTLWLANLLFAGADLDAETVRLAAAVERFTGPVIFVTNEVGFGIVPDAPMGRDFRDAQGCANQRLAAACAHVVLVMAGMPLALKPRPQPDIRL